MTGNHSTPHIFLVKKDYPVGRLVATAAVCTMQEMGGRWMASEGTPECFMGVAVEVAAYILQRMAGMALAVSSSLCSPRHRLPSM